MTTFKPMLAGTLESLADVRYPVLCTPKIDGIRCLITEAGPVSRKLKPIPNDHVRETLWTLPRGLDGELWIPGAKCFGDVSSEVMRKTGRPSFEYLIFDTFALSDMGVPYEMRVRALREMPLPEFARALDVDRIENEAALLRYEASCLEAGFEGVMLRCPHGPYKHGRSTVCEGWLLKLKQFADDEAMIIGVQELLHNDNALECDALGHAKRSTHQDGKRAGGKLGALMLRRPDGLEFNVGTGFTDTQREALWAARENLPGLTVKYRHQGSGAKDAPRFPSFLGFRHEDD